MLGLGTAGKDVEVGLSAKIGQAVAEACDSNKKVKSCALVLPAISGPVSYADLATEFYTNLYSDNRYRTGDKKVYKAEDLESVKIVVEGDVSVEEATKGIVAGKAMAAGVILTKDIVNAPHNALNSESLANTAKDVAEESGGTITIKVLGKEECEERGMGAYLGVARGSETAPQFIHMTYTPKSGKVRYVQRLLLNPIKLVISTLMAFALFASLLIIVKRSEQLERDCYLILEGTTSRQV